VLCGKEDDESPQNIFEKSSAADGPGNELEDSEKTVFT
jgi:hypothetical protein